MANRSALYAGIRAWRHAEGLSPVSLQRCPAAAIALYFMYYNFERIHQTLHVTPGMEAGAANDV